MLHVKCNFSGMYKDRPLGLLCSTCFVEPETQEHSVQCTKLPQQFKLPYKDLFRKDECVLLPSLYSFEKIWRLRNEYLHGWPQDPQ